MITIIIVVVTAILSILCFSNENLFSRLDFEPYRINKKNEYLRFISHTFVHADWVHLIINMLVFYSFGRYVEQIFGALQERGTIFSGDLFYLLLYFGGAVIASVPSFIKHKEDPNYVSVGASGAVSAVLFSSIFFSPMEKIYFYAVIPMPGIVFGVLYLAYSSYMAKKGNDNVNHDAHFWGAVFGFLFPVILDPSLISNFINQF
jgi:membrane associated rhomboid family serine protease